MSQAEHRSFANPFIMLLSAAIFGYMGFVLRYATTNLSGQFVLFFALYVWTLKISAVCFGISGVVAMFNSLIGNLIYAIAGLFSAVMFLVIFALDWMDPVHTVAHSMFFLLIFAAWNGYGSWEGLKSVRDELRDRGEGKERNLF